MIETITYGRRAWKKKMLEEWGSQRAAIAQNHYDEERGIHIVELLKGASTRTRLHELGHIASMHRHPAELCTEWAEMELEAELFAARKSGMAGDRLVSSATKIPVDQLIRWHFTAPSIFSHIVGLLKKKSVSLSIRAKRDLWWYIRNEANKLKEGWYTKGAVRKRKEEKGCANKN